MEHIEFDIPRIDELLFDERLSDVGPKIIQEATSAGAMFGAKVDNKSTREDAENSKKAMIELSGFLLLASHKLKDAKKEKNDAYVLAHNFLPLSIINFLCWEMMVRCANDKYLPPVQLLELVRFQLEIQSMEESNRKELRRNKFNEACKYLLDNPEASLREIAREVDIDYSSVSRWKKNRDMIAWGKNLREIESQIDESVPTFQAPSKKK